MADRMAQDGWLEKGYQYLILDDCWLLKDRDPVTNRQVSDPKRFPRGIKFLSDYIHSKGLKFGMYGDVGYYTCEGFPGSKVDYKLDFMIYI